ncbi:MAG TPA: hypothetical protein VGM17_12300 [Rhizomicrobium sp.]|jgi:hypothetical protein
MIPRWQWIAIALAILLSVAMYPDSFGHRFLSGYCSQHHNDRDCQCRGRMACGVRGRPFLTRTIHPPAR